MGSSSGGAQAQRAVFAGAVFADLNSFVAATLSRGTFVGADFSNAMLGLVDLTNANLSHARFHNANLMGAKLADADSTSADLSEARMDFADCQRVRLPFGNLMGARLRDVLFEDADLSRANLQEAVVLNAKLAGVNFTGCVFGCTTFANVDFEPTHGLDTVIHRGPSVIDSGTALRVAAQSSDGFLTGMGIPHELIPHLRTIGRQSLKLRSCFISYSSKDEQFARKLYRDLQRAHIRVWFFPEDAKWGEPVWKEIDAGIKSYDRLVVLCSEHSLTSTPVLREIERALDREDREHSNILCPLRIDDYMFTGWTHPRRADVLTKVVGDFSGWQRSSAKYKSVTETLDRSARRS